ncbi:MAG: hypothetical protein ACOYL5_01410 [Phototrophicaceae bacterium]
MPNQAAALPPPPPVPYATALEYSASFSGVYEGSVRGVALARRLSSGGRAFHFASSSGYTFILSLPAGVAAGGYDLVTDEAQTASAYVGVLMTADAAEPNFVTAASGRATIFTVNPISGTVEFSGQNAAGQTLELQMAFSELPQPTYSLAVTGALTQTMPPGEPILSDDNGEYRLAYANRLFNHPRLDDPNALQGVSVSVILPEGVSAGTIIMDGTNVGVEVPGYSVGAGGIMNINTIGTEGFTGGFAFSASSSTDGAGITVQATGANIPLITDLPY